MNKNVILAFASGAALGVGATVLYFKKIKKNDCQCQCNCEHEEPKQEEAPSEEQSYEEAPAIVANVGYNKVIKRYDEVKEEKEPIDIPIEDYSEEAYENNIVKEEIPDPSRVYEEIDSSEFNSMIDDFSKSILTLYADDILADEMDERMRVEDTIGKKAFRKFKRRHDDDIYIRNNRIGVDFEVTFDPRTYYDATGIPTEGMED